MSYLPIEYDPDFEIKDYVIYKLELSFKDILTGKIVSNKIICSVREKYFDALNRIMLSDTKYSEFVSFCDYMKVEWEKNNLMFVKFYWDDVKELGKREFDKVERFIKSYDFLPIWEIKREVKREKIRRRRFMR